MVNEENEYLLEDEYIEEEHQDTDSILEEKLETDPTIEQTIKLDYKIESAAERNELVKRVIAATPPEKLTPRYLEILSDYIVFAMDKEEKQKKKIITDNRMITVDKRETSFQGLVSQLENGEDGIYNMIANDKNIIFAPKNPISQHDIDTIPELAALVAEIEKIENAAAAATGKQKYALKKQLIEMRQQQYTIRSSRNQPIYCVNGVKSFASLDLDEKYYIDADGDIKSTCLLDLMNPTHISVLLCNYSRLKEDSWGKFYTDSYFLMEALDDLIEKTLKDAYPLYYDLLIYKIDGKSNLEIQDLLYQKHKIKHSVEYISSLWRNKIPRLLAATAKEDTLLWYYTTQEKGQWKRCSRCGQIKLAHNLFFSKNNTSKDHFYSICKDCRNHKTVKEK